MHVKSKSSHSMLKIKFRIANFIFYFRSSAQDFNRTAFLFRSIFRLKISYKAIREKNPIKLIESYALIFCLTRRHSTYRIAGSEKEIFLEKADQIGISFNGTLGLHGRSICDAHGYAEAEFFVRNEIISILKSEHPFLIPFIHYLNQRYVGHKRCDVERTGYFDGPEFTTIFTQQSSTRSNGSIWTFGQQSCVVVAAISKSDIFLSHHKHGQEVSPDGTWDQIHVFSRTRPKIAGIWHETGKGIGSVCVTQEGIFREEHLAGNFLLPLGPIETIPTGNIEQITNFSISC